MCFVFSVLSILYKVCCRFIVTTPQSPQLNEKSSSYHSTRQNGFYWYMRHSMERKSIFFFFREMNKSFNCFNSLVYYRFERKRIMHMYLQYNYDKRKIMLNDEKNKKKWRKKKHFIYNTLLLKYSFVSINVLT